MWYCLEERGDKQTWLGCSRCNSCKEVSGENPNRASWWDTFLEPVHNFFSLRSSQDVVSKTFIAFHIFVPSLCKIWVSFGKEYYAHHLSWTHPLLCFVWCPLGLALEEKERLIPFIPLQVPCALVDFSFTTPDFSRWNGSLLSDILAPLCQEILHFSI